MHQGLLVGQKILWNLINSLMESGFTQNLCFPQCYKSCPNILDLYFDLAAGEGMIDTTTHIVSCSILLSGQIPP
ncbi:hypothetical protein GLYMA_16G187250v4 [Glycine max]|nr:hypothetical protein GLYMA_16G187250v4 [Glycine max]